MPPEMLVKEMFAEAYRWSEEETENASLDAITWFPLIREAKNHAIEAEQKRQARESRSGR